MAYMDDGSILFLFVSRKGLEIFNPNQMPFFLMLFCWSHFFCAVEKFCFMFSDIYLLEIQVAQWIEEGKVILG